MALLTAPKSQATGAASAKWRGGRLADEAEAASQDDRVGQGGLRAERWALRSRLGPPART